MSNITSILKQHYLFSSMSDEDLVKIAEKSEMFDLKKQESIFFQGDEANNFYYIVDGQVSLARSSPNGQEKIIEIIKKNEIFAEALIFMPQKAHYPVSACSLEKCTIIKLKNKLLKEILNDSHKTSMAILLNMAIKLHALLDEIDSLTLHGASYRLVSFLLHQIPKNNIKNNKENETANIKLDIAKNIIASRLSIKPETLSRSISSLSKRGLIKIDGKHIVINNKKSLQEYLFNN
ncbi:MAG: hypothetical protein DRQ51_02875 [Gammaproteobacteria bacterium]|nr:MAG: hypothetical protein DRQ51_02875 [Gammaproteobacteria bacterium]